MKKFVCVVMMAAMSLSMVACGMSEDKSDDRVTMEVEAIEEDNETTAVGNPWTEADEQETAAATGLDLKAPEGATEVNYSYMEAEGMTQLTYVYEGHDWVYRAQPTEALTDISGLNYTWIIDDPGKVADCEAEYLAYSEQAEDSEFIDDMFFVHAVNWYDAAAGVTYSLSASGKNLDGMDIQVYAENLIAR